MRTFPVTGVAAFIRVHVPRFDCQRLRPMGFEHWGADTAIWWWEPVVCRPQETLDCFLRAWMDVLVLGNTVINREMTE